MKHKVIIFDLDGTAVDSPIHKLPSENLVNQIRRLEDTYFFCVATGRSWTFAKPILEALNLEGYSVISAGTQICKSKGGEIIWQKNLEQHVVDQVVNVMKLYPDWKMLCNDYSEDDYNRGGLYYPHAFVNPVPTYFLEHTFVPNDLAVDEYKKLTEIKDIEVIMVNSRKTGCKDIHIMSALATKEQAITELLKSLKVERINSIGIGDGYNDMHLFNAVNHKIAMGNAVPELKKQADEVIGLVSEDGLAHYLATL